MSISVFLHRHYNQAQHKNYDAHLPHGFCEIVDAVAFSFSNGACKRWGALLHRHSYSRTVVVNTSKKKGRKKEAQKNYVSAVSGTTGYSISFHFKTGPDTREFGTKPLADYCPGTFCSNAGPNLQITMLRGRLGGVLCAPVDLSVDLSVSPASSMASMMIDLSDIMVRKMVDYSTKGWICDRCRRFSCEPPTTQGERKAEHLRWFCRGCGTDICLHCHGADATPFERIWKSQCAIDNVQTLRLKGNSRNALRTKPRGKKSKSYQSFRFGVTDAVLAAVGSAHPPQLKSLTICESLGDYSYSWTPSISASGLQKIALQCSNLTALQLSRSRFKGLDASRLAIVCAALPQLYSLDISHGVIALEDRYQPTFDEFMLDDAQPIEADLQIILSNCPKLTALDIENSFQEMTSSISAIGDNCPLLTALNISEGWELTADSFRGVTERCPELLSIKLRGCDNILSQGGIAFLSLNCTKIQSLEIGPGEEGWFGGEAYPFDDSDCRNIANNLTSMTSLTLFNCKRISDLALKDVAQKLTSLQTLDLDETIRRNAGMTDEGLYYLRISATTLTHLNLGRCHYSDTATARFKSANPDCELVADHSALTHYDY